MLWFGRGMGIWRSMRTVGECRTLKRKAAYKSKGAKKHDYNMMFDAGRDKRALFLYEPFLECVAHDTC
jgi:hypothetical protein